MRVNEVTPILSVRFSASFSHGGWIASMSGPEAVMGANASERAIRIPPHAMKGIANETPVRRCWRRFLSHSVMGGARAGAVGRWYQNGPVASLHPRPILSLHCRRALG